MLAGDGQDLCLCGICFLDLRWQLVLRPKCLACLAKPERPSQLGERVIATSFRRLTLSVMSAYSPDLDLQLLSVIVSCDISH